MRTTYMHHNHKENMRDRMKEHPFLSMLAAFAFAALVGTAVFVGVAQAQVAQTTTSEPEDSPAPMIIDADNTGSVVIRGEVTEVDANHLVIDGWGGSWTVYPAEESSVIPTAATGTEQTGVADYSEISVGDFVGAEGTFAADQDFTVYATFVRDWTTDPIPGLFEGTDTATDAATTTATGGGTTETTADADGAAASDASSDAAADTDMTGTDATDPSVTDSDTTDSDTIYGDATEGVGTGDTEADSFDTEGVFGLGDDTESDTDVNADADAITYSGSVDSVEESSFTFTDDFDNTYDVTVDSGVVLTNDFGEVITLEDLQEGDTVELDGVDENGTITTSLVRVTSQ